MSISFSKPIVCVDVVSRLPLDKDIEEDYINRLCTKKYFELNIKCDFEWVLTMY